MVDSIETVIFRRGVKEARPFAVLPKQRAETGSVRRERGSAPAFLFEGADRGRVLKGWGKGKVGFIKTTARLDPQGPPLGFPPSQTLLHPNAGLPKSR